MEQNYSLDITPRALKHIYEQVLPPNLIETHGLVIYNISATGGCYEIHASSLSKLRTLNYYIHLFPKEYHNHGFDIYVEGLILSGHYLPNPMVLDLKRKSDGQMVLDIKNPAFEIIDEFDKRKIK
jgi:hypothetical protein